MKCLILLLRLMLFFANMFFIRFYAMDIEMAYTTLGVNKDTPFDQVKKKYKELAKEFHPDKFLKGTQEEKNNATAKFIDIKNAYDAIQKNLTKELGLIAKNFEYFSDDIKDESPEYALGLLTSKIWHLANYKKLVKSLEDDRDDYTTFVNALADVGLRYAVTEKSNIKEYFDFIHKYITRNAGFIFLDYTNPKDVKFESEKLTSLLKKITQDTLRSIIKKLTSDEQKNNFYKALKQHKLFTDVPLEWKIFAEKKLLPQHDLKELIILCETEIEKMAQDKNDCENLNTYLKNITALLQWDTLFTKVSEKSKNLLFDTLEKKLKSYKTMCDENNIYKIYYSDEVLLPEIFKLLKKYDTKNRFESYEKFYNFFYTPIESSSNEYIIKNIVRHTIDIANPTMKKLVKDWIEDRFTKDLANIDFDKIIKEVEKIQKQKNAVVDTFAQALAGIAQS